jgi:hypothetical protein
MILTGENQRTWRRTCPSATLSTANTTWKDLGANLGFHGRWLVTKCLRHGTANEPEGLSAWSYACHLIIPEPENMNRVGLVIMSLGLLMGFLTWVTFWLISNALISFWLTFYDMACIKSKRKQFPTLIVGSAEILCMRKRAHTHILITATMFRTSYCPYKLLSNCLHNICEPDDPHKVKMS